MLSTLQNLLKTQYPEIESSIRSIQENVIEAESRLRHAEEIASMSFAKHNAQLYLACNVGLERLRSSAAALNQARADIKTALEDARTEVQARVKEEMTLASRSS